MQLRLQLACEHSPIGLFDAEAEEDSAAVESNTTQAWTALGGAALTRNQQTQMAAAINAPGPAGVGSATHVSVYKKTLQFSAHTEAVEFIDLVSGVRLTGASVDVMTATGPTSAANAKQHGNPAVLLHLVLGERRAILDWCRRGAPWSAARGGERDGRGGCSRHEHEQGRSASAHRAAALRHAQLHTVAIHHPLRTSADAVQHPVGCRELAVGQFGHGRIQSRELAAPARAADGLRAGVDACPSVADAQWRGFRASDACVDGTNVMGSGAGGAVLAPADSGGDADTMAAAVGNSAATTAVSSNLVTGGSGSAKPRVCFFLTKYRIIFVPFAQPNLTPMAVRACSLQWSLWN